MVSGDTIYALSSGVGRAGIAVVRLSGPLSCRVLSDLVVDFPPPRWFCVRELVVPGHTDVVDRAVVVWLPGGGTATGEDMCEFHVHGSEAVLAKLFETFRGYDGLRLAEPGEFSRRSFANDKMDLLEVEGLADLLDARTEGQRQIAMLQLLGVSSSVINSWRDHLVSLLARVDAVLEFSEEDGVAQAGGSGLRVDLVSLVGLLEAAVGRVDSARAMRDGVQVVLAGRPNTGKSSLLNRFAGREAAIVSSVPGTTRDIVEVQLDLGGIRMLLRDTAGLRNHSEDEIEVLGMARTRLAFEEADIVVWVWSEDVVDSELPDGDVVPSVSVLNKCDLDQHQGKGLRQVDGLVPQVRVSALSGAGMAELISRLEELAHARVSGWEQSVVLREREVLALKKSIRHLNDALARDDLHLELMSADLRCASSFLGQITGHIDVEEWLDDIFNRFCIGK